MRTGIGQSVIGLLSRGGLLIVLVGLLAGCSSSSLNSAYEGLKDSELAKYEQELSSEIREGKTDSEMFKKRARFRLARGDYRGARRDYGQVIALEPESKHGYLARAWANESLGDFDAAIADYSRASEIAPCDAGIFYFRAYAYSRKSAYNEAIQDWNRFLQFKPETSSAALLNRGVANWRSGNRDLAMADVSEAIRLGEGPELASAYWFRAKLFSERGQIAESESDLTEAVRRDRSYLSDLEKLFPSFQWIAEEARVVERRP